MNFKFSHFNFNVMNIENSKKFYDEALGLTEFHRIEDPSGEYLIVYLQDEKTCFELDWDYFPKTRDVNVQPQRFAF